MNADAMQTTAPIQTSSCAAHRSHKSHLYPIDAFDSPHPSDNSRFQPSPPINPVNPDKSALLPDKCPINFRYAGDKSRYTPDKIPVPRFPPLFAFSAFFRIFSDETFELPRHFRHIPLPMPARRVLTLARTMKTIFFRVQLLIAAAGLMALAGCSKQPSTPAGNTDGGAAAPAAKPAGKKLTVGFSQVGAESDWRVAESKSVKDEAAKRGIDLKFSDAQGKQENQFKAISSFIAQGVDGIILAPKVETGWDQVLKDAKAAKIPVILVDRGIDVKDDSLYATLIASDFVSEGRMAAEWLAKKTGGKANIIELEGTPGAAPAKDRKAGFAEGIKGYPDMKIIAAQSGDFETGKGKEVMETLLQKFGGTVNAVYAHNDNMALGAIEAIKAAGKKPGVDITIVSIDGVKSAFTAMVAGDLNCTVECNPLLGQMAFDALDKSIKGDKLPKKTVVQDKVYDQTVAKDVIGSRQY